MGGECKQKRASTRTARLSDGNQLRNCWSQAVLTGPYGAIYQINRGGSDSRRMMGPTRRASSICQEATRCRRPDRPAWRAKRDGSNVCSAQRRGWWLAHPGGTRDIETSCRSDVSRVSCRCAALSSTRPVRCIPRENADERVQRRYIVARPSPSPQFRRRYAICADVISRRQRRNMITLGGVLKCEKCDSAALIRRQEVISAMAL